MQAVQNFACPIVSGAKKYDHVTTLLKSLSWLPVKGQLYYRRGSWLSPSYYGFQMHARPVKPLNILHPNLLPVSKLANEQLGLAKS